MTGRHGCAGLGPPIRGRYRQAVHQAGRPACGPYGIAMGRWNFVHFAGQPACAPYGIAMDHSPLPSRSARFPISPLCHCSPFSFSFSEEPFDSVHTDWRQGIQILFRGISPGSSSDGGKTYKTVFSRGKTLERLLKFPPSYPHDIPPSVLSRSFPLFVRHRTHIGGTYI